jgi:hypothetical protein
MVDDLEKPKEWKRESSGYLMRGTAFVYLWLLPVRRSNSPET